MTLQEIIQREQEKFTKGMDNAFERFGISEKEMRDMNELLSESLTRAIKKAFVATETEIEYAHTYASENADLYRVHDYGQKEFKVKVAVNQKKFLES